MQGGYNTLYDTWHSYHAFCGVIGSAKNIQRFDVS
jgi:hypothetical protein